MNELRAALDQAQNKGPNGPNGGSEQGLAANQSPSPGDANLGPSQQTSAMSPVKPVLSFSDIRNAAKGDGVFRDLRQKTKLRDW